MNQHVIHAIATYICVTAHNEDVFTKEVDTSHICELLGASVDEQKEAYAMVRTILRDFIDYPFFEKPAISKL